MYLLKGFTCTRHFKQKYFGGEGSYLAWLLEMSQHRIMLILARNRCLGNTVPAFSKMEGLEGWSTYGAIVT